MHISLILRKDPRCYSVLVGNNEVSLLLWNCTGVLFFCVSVCNQTMLNNDNVYDIPHQTCLVSDPSLQQAAKADGVKPLEAS